jgi:hypothetical protein
VVRRDLERGLHPLVVLPSQYLFAIALLFQVAALVGLPSFVALANGMLATALAIGMLTLVYLLVDYTTAPTGSLAHRVRGVACASTSCMVVGFTLAWYAHGQVAAVGVLAIELVAYVAALVGNRWATMTGWETVDHESWPFSPAR